MPNFNEDTQKNFFILVYKSNGIHQKSFYLLHPFFNPGAVPA